MRSAENATIGASAGSVNGTSRETAFGDVLNYTVTAEDTTALGATPFAVNTWTGKITLLPASGGGT
jgi:hypothetical protein